MNEKEVVDDLREEESLLAQKKYAAMSDEELLQFIREKTEEFGRPPKVDEVTASRYIKRRLGAWPRVLEKAGVKPPSPTYMRRVANRKAKRRKSKANKKNAKAREKEKLNSKKD